MISRTTGGGGNPASMRLDSESVSPIIIRRTAAIGDALCATVVADRLNQMGYEVEFQSHPNIHCVLRRHRGLFNVSNPSGFCHVDLDGAYETDPARRSKHFHQMFFEAANRQLLARGLQIGEARNCRPRIVVRENEMAAARSRFSSFPRPWVFICPRSDSYACRQVPNGIWQSAAESIRGTKFWTGRHPGPPGIIDLGNQHFDNVIVWLSVADILVTVDTGPMHVGAALGIPMVVVSQSSSPDLHLNDQNDFIGITPSGLDCLNCQRNLCPINAHMPPCQNIEPHLIAQWTNAKLAGAESDDVSAIIPIYQPELKTLNRCLEQVLPQVSEVIVTAETNSRLPEGAMKHPKIRYVRKAAAGIGFGGNVNYGVRHSTGGHLLILNDDVFLDPGAVDAMKREMVAGVGMVSQLLRYPDGTIYHAGKFRSPGMRGWGHIDHKKHIPTIKEPVEMENMNLASCLVRRRAFYDARCFDENFRPAYAEDDDLCLSMRRVGWRLIYTPHASGIHMEHQSTKKLGNIMDIVKNSNSEFGKKWSRYLDHNANRVPGTFDYLLV